MEYFLAFMYTVIVWFLVVPFIPPFDKWQYTFHMQLIGAGIFFVVLTSSVSKSNPNYTPPSSWLGLLGMGVAVYCLYSIVNDERK